MYNLRVADIAGCCVRASTLGPCPSSIANCGEPTGAGIARVPSGFTTIAIEQLKDFETHGSACDRVLSRDEGNEDGAVRPRRGGASDPKRCSGGGTGRGRPTPRYRR